MSWLKDRWDDACKILKSKAFWMLILSLIGIGLYVLGCFVYPEGIIHEVLFQAGNVIIVSGVIGFLSNASTFLGIFKKDIQSVVYGEELLANQKDVTSYWKTASKQMFKNKFPDIHEEFLSVIEANLPKDEVSYYKDYEMRSVIEWENENESRVKVTDIVRFELIADSKKKFTYPLKNWIKTSGEGNEISSTMLSFKVNGEERVDEVNKHKQTPTVQDGERCEEFDVPLGGKRLYQITYKVEKRFSLLEDHCKGFQAKYIVKNCRFSIEVPENIHMQFESRGALNRFEDIEEIKSNKMTKIYNGILLPKQGFIVALQKQ